MKLGPTIMQVRVHHILLPSWLLYIIPALALQLTLAAHAEGARPLHLGRRGGQGPRVVFLAAESRSAALAWHIHAATIAGSPVLVLLTQVWKPFSRVTHVLYVNGKSPSCPSPVPKTATMHSKESNIQQIETVNC